MDSVGVKGKLFFEGIWVGTSFGKLIMPLASEMVKAVLSKGGTVILDFTCRCYGANRESHRESFLYFLPKSRRAGTKQGVIFAAGKDEFLRGTAKVLRR